MKARIHSQIQGLEHRSRWLVVIGLRAHSLILYLEQRGLYYSGNSKWYRTCTYVLGLAPNGNARIAVAILRQEEYAHSTL